MALTHNGTIVSIPAAQLPTGYTKPTVTDFTDHEVKYEGRSFTIAKATVEHATATTTMGNLITQLNTAIQALINADLDTDVITATSYAELKSLSTNNTLAGVLFTNGAISYVLTVDIYIKTA